MRDLKIAHYEFQLVECPECLKKMINGGYEPGKMIS